MKEFVIIADSCCDLPIEVIEKYHIDYIGLSCNINGVDIMEGKDQKITYKEFYDQVRSGAMPTTSQISSYRFKEKFKEYVEKGIGVLYIGFSSKLSGTYNSSVVAKDELFEEYPEANIITIDSKAASSGLGLILVKAAKLKEQGKSMDEIANWVENNKLRICHFFTVDDLNHLKRGGRISATTAAVGSLLSIKPVMYTNDEGELKPYSKARGMKKAIKMIYDNFESHLTEDSLEDIIITHADNLEGAIFLKKLIEENHEVKNIIISNIGLVIGSHTGAGTMSVYLLGTNRKPDR
ncbi:DegV family protein [Clostridium sp. DL1XJH146]